MISPMRREEIERQIWDLQNVFAADRRTDHERNWKIRELQEKLAE